jgi:molybdenum cofactor guanylyltransferase
MLTKEDITVGILAGGKATRMNHKDKGLVLVNKKPLIEKILETVSENTSKIIINANRNLSTYKNYNYPVISDSLDNFQGPLSGIYSMLKSIDTDYLITLPCDCPNFSWYVIQKMIDHSNEENDVCVAHNGIRSQPVFMLVSKSKVQSLHNYLANGDRKIDIWYKQNNHKYIYFDNDTQYFDNINTTEQLNEYNSK